MEGTVDIYVYGFADVSLIYQIKLIYNILYNIAKKIGGKEWRFDIGDFRKEGTIKKQRIVSSDISIMY